MTMTQLRTLTDRLLDEKTPSYRLRPEVMELAGLLVAAQTHRPAAGLTIADGETRTPNGLALSPTMAAMCIEGHVRTIEFLRGTHAAISQVRVWHPNRPVRVLYAGCGPYALLALPLMAVFTPSEAMFTMIDIHPDSIASARSIVETLRLADSVAAYETCNAASFAIGSDEPPDVVLTEMMQAALEAEPQVAVTRHLIRQAPRALLVPEEIRVDLMFVDPASEFGVPDPSGAHPKARHRVPLGTVFTLNRKTALSWTDIRGPCLPAASISAPPDIGPGFEPMLYTAIDVFGQHRLGYYSDGLTTPKRLGVAEAIRQGDLLEFHYRLGPHPGLAVQITRAADAATRGQR